MEINYLIRSKMDGKYVAASLEEQDKYLLLFQEQFDALSYLNTHAADLANRFSVDAIAKTEIKGLLSRWGFKGVALVEDPLIPQLKFLTATRYLDGI